MEQLPLIERNFHILNDDRFIMEKISLPIEMQDGEDIHAAINRTRETIVQNFKAAYPKVEESLNFHVVRQLGGLEIWSRDHPVNWNRHEEPKSSTHEKGEAMYIPSPSTIATPENQKINKGTIEEQIQACTEIEGKEDHQLESFKLFVEMNKKYKPIYDEKLTELKRSGVIRKSKMINENS